MKSQAIALTLLGLISAHAAVASPATNDASIEKIQGLFDSAKLPSAESLNGIWDGRCFPNSESESSTQGALLIGNDPRSVGGPLFEVGGTVNFRIAYGAASQFDTFNPNEMPLPSSEESYGDVPAKAVDGSYRLQAGTWGDWSSVWKVRWLASKGYLVALQYTVRSEGEDAVPLYLKRACYFFKRLR